MEDQLQKVAIIVAPVVCHNLDPHTGIPFMPHMAAHLGGALHHAGYDVQVIDAFGLQPNKVRIHDEFMFLGEDEYWIERNIRENTEAIFIYCRTMAEYVPIMRIVGVLKDKRPNVRIALFENIQSVTSFSLNEISDDLLNGGCDVLVMGEPEQRAQELAIALIEKRADYGAISGVAWMVDGKVQKSLAEPFNKSLDDLPLPLWERFPLKGYWIAGFAHAPNTERKFLPILTSRGCPYRCTFCISPSLNPNWRGRSAKSVVDEMEYFYRVMGITEFHVSDLDPTVNDKRTKAICEDIISRCLPITWKLAQGTKIETIKSEKTLELMKKSGVTFVAFSPESGSPRMLEVFNKPFDHEHALKMLRKMSELGIHTQACFIGGVPSEEKEDRLQSLSYLKKLMKAGLDEVAVYVFAPIPGAKLSQSLKGYATYSQCTFSPTWRDDYDEINAYRFQMYRLYFCMLFLQPVKVFKRAIGFLSGRHHTKMEMSIKKQIKLSMLRCAPWLFPRLKSEVELERAQKRIVHGYDILKK
tara:strand:+ start:10005 stop:11585 length:1581 start_codon:yes stop_codon:yes gene_type:complete